MLSCFFLFFSFFVMYYESVLIHGFEKQQMINDSLGSFRQLHNSQLVGQVHGINHREFQQQKKERGRGSAY